MNDDALIELLIVAIHEGLGGNGWAYSNYGGNELETERESLTSAARNAIEIFRRYQGDGG